MIRQGLLLHCIGLLITHGNGMQAEKCNPFEPLPKFPVGQASQESVQAPESQALEYRLNDFPCDTVFVPKGTKAFTGPGMHWYFRPEHPNRIIQVEGELHIIGTRTHPVCLSGRLDSGKGAEAKGAEANGVGEAGTGATDAAVDIGTFWGGIRVAQSGKLVVRHAVFLGAKTPVLSHSRGILLENITLHRSGRFILPDGTFLAEH